MGCDAVRKGWRERCGWQAMIMPASWRMRPPMRSNRPRVPRATLMVWLLRGCMSFSVKLARRSGCLRGLRAGLWRWLAAKAAVMMTP